MAKRLLKKFTGSKSLIVMTASNGSKQTKLHFMYMQEKIIGLLTDAAMIKTFIDTGVKVYWSNDAYEVIKDRIGQYLIHCTLNGHCIGLTWQDGITLNGKPEEFYYYE